VNNSFVVASGSQHGNERQMQPLKPTITSTASWPKPNPDDQADPWVQLANQMKDEADSPKDEPDAEENPFVPAGYTYFGQFVDHDLTFDTASNLDLGDDTPPSNDRTTRFDLDCVYGQGPADAPFMYVDGVKLVDATVDLPRAPNGRAIIGDPRNDENSIVCQIQMAFIRFHNAVVDRLAASSRLSGDALFKRAKAEVQWTYQAILIEDYLPRIVSAEDIAEFDKLRKPDPNGRSTDRSAFKLFKFTNPVRIPLEFSGAAYRFGHSMIRNGYRLNANTKKHIFSPSGPDSLVGFGPLPVSHLIDWSLFLPDPDLKSPAVTPGTPVVNNQSGRDRMQLAYKIDPLLADPLARLPAVIAEPSKLVSLQLRNLVRGYKLMLSSGQELATLFGIAKRPRLATRKKEEKKGTQSFTDIPSAFQQNTPLWFYILAEAQQSVVDSLKEKSSFGDDELVKLGTQLTGVGARTVLEVFHGLLDADPDSVRNSSDLPKDWKRSHALIANFRLWDLVTCNLKESP